MKNKVFVVNKGAHDYSPAEKYGEIVYLSDSVLNRLQTGYMYRLFSSKLRTSTKNDYILITSLTQMNGIAMSIMAVLHGRVNMLIYNERGYTVRTVDFHNLLTPFSAVETEEELISK